MRRHLREDKVVDIEELREARGWELALDGRGAVAEAVSGRGPARVPPGKVLNEQRNVFIKARNSARGARGTPYNLSFSPISDLSLQAHGGGRRTTLGAVR